jgi:soluble lytic murein transglycosylase
MQGAEELEGRTQLRQARKLVESYNASVKALNTIGDRRMVTGIVERVESAGRPDAVSSAGALGLMQLMPSTAREVATRLGMPENVDVMDPTINRQLGDQYFGEMFNKYNNMALSLAAYNAGPGRVDSWLQSIGDPRSGDLSVSEWINKIPYRETREYVKRVLG